MDNAESPDTPPVQPSGPASGPPRAPAPEPAVNRAALEELAADLGMDTMLAAVRQLEHDVGAFLSRLSSSQDAGDRAGVQKAAHGLKGLFEQFGVPALAEVAVSLASHRAAGTPETSREVQHLLNAAPAAIAGVLAYTQALVPGAQPPACPSGGEQ